MADKIIISPKRSLKPEDIAKWLRNQKTFLAPLGLLYLAFVIANVTKDGISAKDFIPYNEVITAMALYLLNALYDLFRKWAGENKNIVK